jgi:uncharacterized protein YutE (UPF0331/DUF86 family)
MVVKTRLVLERLHALDEYIRLLEPYREWDIQRLTKDQIVYGGVLHYLQLSAQAVMDVSAHLQVELGLERISDYRGAILSLSKHDVLPSQFAERVSALAGFRNILVHEYLTIDPLKVSEALHSGLDDLRAFVMHIADFLRREGYLQGDR